MLNPYEEPLVMEKNGDGYYLSKLDPFFAMILLDAKAGCFSLGTYEKLGRVAKHNLKPCVEWELCSKIQCEGLFSQMTADRNLSLTVRHLFAVFVHCFHYPTVRAKHLPWFLFGMPQNTLQQTSTCKKHNNVFLGSKDFNGCKHCFDARLSARFSLQPHKHAYHAYKQIRVDIILHSLEWPSEDMWRHA